MTVAFFTWLESTAVSRWVVESLWAFPIILTVHAIGMGMAAGLSTMLDLRILGVSRNIPIAELRRFVPILWVGFVLNAISGVLLLLGYPTKALTNPVFYIKLAFIAGGMLLLVAITRRLFGRRTSTPDRIETDSVPLLRQLAIASLVCWAGAIIAGRFLAYTYNYLTSMDL
jgi:hypothetical protein